MTDRLGSLSYGFADAERYPETAGALACYAGSSGVTVFFIQVTLLFATYVQRP